MSDVALAGFPTDGSTYGILTSGDANLADDPNTSGWSGAHDGGSTVRGDTDSTSRCSRSTSPSRSAPTACRSSSASCRTSIPEFVNSTYQRRVHRGARQLHLDDVRLDDQRPGQLRVRPERQRDLDQRRRRHVDDERRSGRDDLRRRDPAPRCVDTRHARQRTRSTSRSSTRATCRTTPAVFLDDLFVGHTAEEGGCTWGATTVSTSKTADSATPRSAARTATRSRSRTRAARRRRSTRSRTPFRRASHTAQARRPARPPTTLTSRVRR